MKKIIMFFVVFTVLFGCKRISSDFSPKEREFFSRISKEYGGISISSSNEGFSGIAGGDESLNPGEISIDVSDSSTVFPKKKIITDDKVFSQLLFVKNRIVKLSIHEKLEMTSEIYKIIGEFPNLRELKVYDMPFQDEDAKQIGDLNCLEKIIIGTVFITGKTLKIFGKLENIKEIKIGWYLTKETSRYYEGEFHNITVDITDNDIKYLKDLKNLESLDFANTKITDDGLRILSDQKHKKLKKLALNNSLITDNGLEYLSKIDSLKELSIMGTMITNEGLISISNCKNIECLDLTDTNVSDKGVLYLKEVPMLESIVLNETKVTSRCLPYFKKFPKIRFIEVLNTKLEEKEVRKMQKLGFNINSDYDHND